MRSRTRPSEERPPERERQKEERTRGEGEKQREVSRTRVGKDVRVGKIQWHFLKELEEKALLPKDFVRADEMAEKIRQYPLSPAHVMSSWERYTKTAIEDYKAGVGNNDDRDQQHRAYAVVFSAVRSGQGVNDAKELNARIREVALRNDELPDDPARPRPWKEDTPDAPLPRKRGDDVTAKEVPSKMAIAHDKRSAAVQKRTEATITEELPSRAQPDAKVPERAARAPTQRTLALPEQTFGQERSGLDDRVDKMIGRLRELPHDQRRTIEEGVFLLLVNHKETQRGAREALPQALDDLKRDRSSSNTVHALTLAVITRVPEHESLLAELRKQTADEQREVNAMARAQVARYQLLDGGASLLERDEIGAAIHSVLNPSSQSKKELFANSQARRLMEANTDPKERSWARIGADMVSEPA